MSRIRLERSKMRVEELNEIIGVMNIRK
jgi:hypothetical protein